MNCKLKAFAACLMLAHLYAQTTKYPGAVDDNTSLFITADNVSTTLQTAMAASDTVAIVKNPAGFAPNMIATVCDTVNGSLCTQWEHMFVTAVSGNTVTVTRAFAGTTARSHSSGRTIAILIDSVHQKVLKDAVVAIETALGPNLSNITSGGIQQVPLPFSSYSCNSSAVCIQGGLSGMSLIAGNNTVTMQPVPNGMNGSDANHYVYVSGGTGAADACLITGGSGTSGQASGQIILNCNNTHSGAWTIRSASGGIHEAIQAVLTRTAGAGGSVYLTPGRYDTYATITVPSNTAIQGAGDSSVVFIPNNTWPSGNTGGLRNTTVGSPQIIWCHGANNILLDSFKIDENATNQGSNVGGGGDVTFANCTHATANNITVANTSNTPFTDLNGLALTPNETNRAADNMFSNNRVYHVKVGSINCGGGYLTQGLRTQFRNNYIEQRCDNAYITNGPTAIDNIIDGNISVINGPSYGVDDAYHVEGSVRTTVSNNVCEDFGYACYAVSYNGPSGMYHVKIIHNSCAPSPGGTAPGICLNIDNATGPSTWLMNALVITDNSFRGASGYGILMTTNTALNPSLNGVVISNNLIENCGQGIFFDSSNPNMSDMTVQGNLFLNNSMDFNSPAWFPKRSVASGNISIGNTTTNLPTGMIYGQNTARVHSGCNGAATSNQTAFLALWPPGSCGTLDTTPTMKNVFNVAGSGYAHNLYVNFGNTVPASTTVTVFKNGSATALTCNISVGSGTCNDTTHSVLVTPTDQITIQLTTGAGAYGSQGLVVSFLY